MSTTKQLSESVPAYRYRPSVRQRRRLLEQLGAATALDAEHAASTSAIMNRVAHAVSEMVDAPFVIHRPEALEEGWDLAFIEGSQVSDRTMPGFRAGLTGDKLVLPYNPLRPDPAERNQILSLDPAARGIDEGYREFLKRIDLYECVHNRVLACEGPKLLAWAGAFSARDARSIARARWGLRAASRQLSAVLRRVVGLVSSDRDALNAALFDAMPGEAYLMTAGGTLDAANELGAIRLTQTYRAIMGELRAAVAGTSPGDFDVHSAGGSPTRRTFLLVRRAVVAPRLEAVIEAARSRWSLSIAETRILRLLTRGAANKEIAEETGLSVRTVEAHLNSLIVKSHSTSRLQVVSRVWLQA